MAEREFGTCKGCGAEIEWARLNGKAHPFDVDPDAKGSYILCDLASEPQTVAVYVKPQNRKQGDRLVVSHFATCPQASSFRKQR